mgnify:CR=1 FL=1
MDWAKEFGKMLSSAADRVEEISVAFGDDAVDFENILIRRGGPMIRPKLRKSVEEAREHDMSTEKGRFLLQQEAMFEDALEGK